MDGWICSIDYHTKWFLFRYRKDFSNHTRGFDSLQKLYECFVSLICLSYSSTEYPHILTNIDLVTNHIYNLDNLEIYHGDKHGRNLQKVADFDIKPALTAYLFQHQFQLSSNQANQLTNKILKKYDFLIRLPLVYSKLSLEYELTIAIKEASIEFYYPFDDYQFSLITQENLHLMQLLFEQTQHLPYIKNTRDIAQHLKDVKRYYTNIRKLENDCTIKHRKVLSKTSIY